MLENKLPSDIRGYVLIVWKRRWIVFCVALIVVVSGFIRLAAETPLFTASAKVLIEQPMQPLGGQFVYPSYSDYGASTETHRQILQSKEFLRKVANELNQPDPAGARESGTVDPYQGEPFHILLSGLRTISSFFQKHSSPSPPAPAKSAAEASEKGLAAHRPLYSAAQVSARLSVKGIKDTDILLIVCTCADPREAALIANTTAEVFIQDRLARRLESTQQGITWLQNHLKSEQAGLDRSRIELYDFMNTYGILSLDEKRGTKLEEELKLLEEKARAASENAGMLEIKYQQTLKLAASPNLLTPFPKRLPTRSSPNCAPRRSSCNRKRSNFPPPMAAITRKFPPLSGSSRTSGPLKVRKSRRSSTPWRSSMTPPSSRKNRSRKPEMTFRTKLKT